MFPGDGVSKTASLPFVFYQANLLSIAGFYINLPVGGLVGFVLLFIKIPDQIVKSWNSPIWSLILEKFDLGGFALFAPAAIQLLLALQFGGTNFPWNSATIIGLFCGAGGTLIAFIFWEHRQGENAMIPLSLISQRTVWSSCLAMMSITSMTFAASYFLPVYFQAVKGVSPLLSGVYLLPSILSQLVLAVLSGIIGRFINNLYDDYHNSHR